ncbi:transcription intermediary factor 1-alpha [Galendromus occidentalis]|uniref:Transcription intermediary factor 1-alpha n=1 Tax=Galendromus occidentalis TaxID=34638 RepID=A0AAJ6QXM8_9ACAR|nr:transcription intermediary factor 1-alpha [Galendromus occidentalis]
MADTDIGANWSPPVGTLKKCSICSNDVTVSSEPFLLPCLHTACRACLPLEKTAVQCSFCELTFFSNSAVRHLVLIERLERESPKEEAKNDESARNMCTSCDEGVSATGYCKDCEEWLCGGCISAHQRVKVTKDHQILSTEQAGQALKAAAKKRFQMCEKHPKEPLKFYCSKCSTLTCRDCQLEDHQNHGDYLALAAAWEQQRPQLKILQERIAEKQTLLREYVASLEKCQESNGKAESTVVNEIRAYAIKCVVRISSRAKALIRDVQQLCDSKRDSLHYKRHELVQLCKKLLDCHSTVEELIKTGSDLALVHSKSYMEKYMESLIEKVVHLPNSKAEISLKFNHEPKIIELLATFGSITDTSTLHVRGVPMPGLKSGHNGHPLRPPCPTLGLNGRAPVLPPSSSKPAPQASSTPKDILPKRTPSSPIPIDSSKDDVITGDVEPTNANGSIPAVIPRSTATPPATNVAAAGTGQIATPAATTTQGVPTTGVVTSTVSEENDASDDWCAVCHDGGELLCCGLCPRVYHLHCHLPTLVSTPSEDWKCTLCTPIQEDSQPASKDGNSKRKIPVGLSGKQLKIAEKILLQLFCHNKSAPFQTPVSRTVPNYFKIITRPMDLSTVKQKLSTSHFNHYESARAFIQDIKLIFSNCYTFNAKESTLAKQAQVLEEFFKHLIEKELPECVADLNSQNQDEVEAAKRAKTS